MVQIKKTPRGEKRKGFAIMMKFFQRLGKAFDASGSMSSGMRYPDGNRIHSGTCGNGR